MDVGSYYFLFQIDRYVLLSVWNRWLSSAKELLSLFDHLLIIKLTIFIAVLSISIFVKSI